MFVLAHLSDPHLAFSLRPRLSELRGKRALGLLNWGLRRRSEHRSDIIEGLLADLASQACDHVAVTGDLVNVALPGEFSAARMFLERIGPPDRVTFVPGNHDAYVAAAAPLAFAHWGAYMAGDAAATAHDLHFPFVRRRGAVALIGLSTGVPTGLFRAWGRLGAEQIERLRAVLAQVAGEGLFRVVLLHHPPVPQPRDRHKDLVDAAAFRAAVRDLGAELILHGHAHLSSLAWVDAPAGAAAPVLGVPSASARGRHHHPAGYNLYFIEGSAGAWRCSAISRGFAVGSAGVAERARCVLHPRPD